MKSAFESLNMIRPEGRTIVLGYAENGFVVSGVHILGSVILCPEQTFLWDIQKPEDITIDSLKLFEHLNPTPDILLIGTGDSHHIFPQEFVRYFIERGISVDFMNSRAAVSTFNVLNEEGRNVCAAILSLQPVHQRRITPKETPELFESNKM